MKTAFESQPATGNIALNGSDVILYNTKKGQKAYSAVSLNESYGYYIVPLENPDMDLGFWAKFEDCTVLYN
jgi:hypothetical protein